MFHLVSLSLQISLTVMPGSRLGLCVWVLFCLFGRVGCWFLSLGKFVFNHRLTPVVDRPSLALVRQCRKNYLLGGRVCCFVEEGQRKPNYYCQ